MYQEDNIIQSVKWQKSKSGLVFNFQTRSIDPVEANLIVIRNELTLK